MFEIRLRFWKRLGHTQEGDMGSLKYRNVDTEKITTKMILLHFEREPKEASKRKFFVRGKHYGTLS